MTLDLTTQLTGHLFPFLLVFTRLAAGFMMFPGIGEAFVSPRIRMMFALAITFLVYPVLMNQIPAIPDHPADLARLIGFEALVGIFFGAVMRLIMDIIETAGSIVAMEIGLSNAMIFNPAQASQSALPSAFLGTAAIVLIFVTGMDRLLFLALLDTYKIFPVGHDLPYGDIVQSFIHVMSQCFSVGVQLAAPFIILGLLFYVVLGVMQRLMPQIQLFLVILPLQIWGGFFILSVCAGVMLGVWLHVFDGMVGDLFIREG